jgi:transposase
LLTFICGIDFKKSELKPWLKKEWKIPPRASDEFVWRMEAILEIYKRPYDPRHPVICFDESSKQQIQDVINSIPMKPGTPCRYDSEYMRNGVSNLFMIFEPLSGKRYVKVTNQRTKKDWAECIKYVADELYPDLEKITIVMDNLNTHSPASLYANFTPEEARRLTEKVEIEYTPKHGSWLNMAEIEFSALSRQCLRRRIGTQEELIEEVKAWEEERNAREVKCDWQFRTEDARIKLRKLYPVL